MTVISSGQITIVDLYDAPALNAWISSSATVTQTYNNQTKQYVPNYASAPLTLTLNLTKAGSASSIIGSDVSAVKWIKIVNNVETEIITTVSTATDYKGGTANSVLTTKSNIPTESNSIIWRVEGIYTVPATGLPVAFSATINLMLVQLAKASVVAMVSAPNGDFFRNDTPSSLKVTTDVYKDGSLSAGSRKFKWFASDTSVTTSQDSDAGVGWRKITATSGTSGEIANSGFDVAVTTQGVLTVYPNAVTNAQTYMVVVTDNDGGTAGTKIKQYITLRDMDDPMMVVIDSSGGTILKNGGGSTVLTARLYQNGEEVDTSGTKYTYKWTKWENNSMVPNFGGSGVSFKSGKTLSVGNGDVNSTSTFKVGVETK